MWDLAWSLGKLVILLLLGAVLVIIIETIVMIVRQVRLRSNFSGVVICLLESTVESP